MQEVGTPDEATRSTGISFKLFLIFRVFHYYFRLCRPIQTRIIDSLIFFLFNNLQRVSTMRTLLRRCTVKHNSRAKAELWPDRIFYNFFCCTSCEYQAFRLSSRVPLTIRLPASIASLLTFNRLVRIPLSVKAARMES